MKTLIVASLVFAALISPVLASQEAADFYVADQKVCSLENGAMTGLEWDICETKVYDFTQSAAVNNSEIKALINDILALLAQISALAN